MECLPDSESAAVWVFLERKTEGKTTFPFCSAQQNCLECKMEQAEKRQQAKNSGSTERAQEQTWGQASKVSERKGFISGHMKKIPTSNQPKLWRVYFDI